MGAVVDDTTGGTGVCDGGIAPIGNGVVCGTGTRPCGGVTVPVLSAWSNEQRINKQRDDMAKPKERWQLSRIIVIMPFMGNGNFLFGDRRLLETGARGKLYQSMEQSINKTGICRDAMLRVSPVWVDSERVIFVVQQTEYNR